MNFANLKLNDQKTDSEQAEMVCQFGRDTANDWLKNPSVKRLAYMRNDFQNLLMDALTPNIKTELERHAAATEMLLMLAVFSAGVDEVLESYILMVQAPITGGVHEHH